jgi:hypothetical protein
MPRRNRTLIALVSLVGALALVTSPALTATTPIGTQLLPLVVIGTAFAVAGALGAFVLGRRRSLRLDPAGR